MPFVWPYAFASATTTNSRSTTSSVISRPICVRALSSMPTTQIQVIPMMKAMPNANVAQFVCPAWFQPKRENVYCAAISARLGMMMRSAIMLLHPPSQPRRGPIARVTQVKLVPQSGSARLR